jgi:hypothetical protein
LTLDRRLLVAAGAYLALASSAAAQPPKDKPAAAPKPAAAAAKAAPAPSAPQDPAQEAKVKARVTEYWKQRMEEDLGSLLPFYESSFRSSLTPQKFARDYRRLNRFNPEFLGVDAVKLDSPTKATIKVKLRTKVAALEGAELISSTEEVWVFENGQWFKAAEPMLPNL